jgi:hypothetical protein
MTAHGEALRAESNDDQLVEGVKQDYTRLDLSPAERAMLDYAVLSMLSVFTTLMTGWLMPRVSPAMTFFTGNAPRARYRARIGTLMASVE